MARSTQGESRRNSYLLDLQIVTCRRERTCICWIVQRQQRSWQRDFFCDSKSDYAIGKDVNKIAKLIAEGICNKKLGTATKVKEALKTAVKKVAKATVYAKVVTKSDPLMIRQSANGSSKVIGKIPKGASVEVIAKGSTWTKVKYKSVIGYSAKRYLKF